MIPPINGKEYLEARRDELEISLIEMDDLVGTERYRVTQQILADVEKMLERYEQPKSAD